MTARRIVLWRHGETDFNASDRVQGEIDIDLNARGREQVTAAAGPLAQRFYLGRLVSSDLRRAQDTARELAALTAQEVILDQRLRERHFGELEGLAVASLDELHPGAWPRIVSRTDAGELGVETLPELAERGYAALLEHTEHTPSGTDLVLAAHGHLIAAVTTRALGLDVLAFDGFAGLGNGHYSVLEPSGSPHRLFRLSEYGVRW